jgi:rhamnose utilization protein RhaD (predicted bifunctional aldolase and dehydrogenase)
MPNLEQLVRISQMLGRSRYYVQGGGGNTSCEMGDLTYVKGSGLSLADATDKGFVPVFHDQVAAGLPKCTDEESYVDLVNQSVLRDGETYPRPSIETGFHSFLGPVVLHSHSVWTNLLACSLEGQRLAQDILPNATWVTYARPGLPIALSLQVAAKSGSSIYILENHGLIVCDMSVDATWELHQSVNDCVRKALGFTSDAFDSVPHLSAAHLQILFPDQAVYFASDVLRQSKAGIDTQWAYDALMFGMQTKGLTPRFLDFAETEGLLNMESERFRQKVSQQ